MNRIRPSIIDDSMVPGARYMTYYSAIEQYQKAFQQGYYIECISLMESLIADRLESLANQISSTKNYSYKPLERLLEYLLGTKQKDKLNDELLNCLDDIKTWKDGRNMAIHEMAKLSEDLEESFQTRYNKLKKIADNGYKVFRKIDNSIRRFRKIKLVPIHKT